MEKNYAQELLKKIRKDYNLIAQEFSRTRSYLWPELAFLIQYATEGERVLDLGCGNGRLFQVLKEKKIDYIGVDFSSQMIEIAREKNPQGKFLLANALNLPFSENFFDKIYSLAVFHHLPSREFRVKFLKEAQRVLKPKGLLILTVWRLRRVRHFKLILKFLILKIFKKTKLDFRDVFIPWGKKCQRYVHLFSKKELKELIKEAGFRLKKIGIIKRKGAKDKNFYLIAQKI